MIGRLLCWATLVAVTALPLVLHRRDVRIFSVVILLFVAHSLLWSGLRLAARNADIPDQATLNSQVAYADAWQAGRMATQASADAYLMPLTVIFMALGILALSPVFTKRSQSHAEQVPSEAAPSAAPNEPSA